LFNIKPVSPVTEMFALVTSLCGVAQSVALCACCTHGLNNADYQERKQTKVVVAVCPLSPHSSRPTMLIFLLFITGDWK